MRGRSSSSIVSVSSLKGFTDVLIINESQGDFSGLVHIHLPSGPTAHYRLSSVRCCSELLSHGLPSAHRPEVICNNFITRLGARVGRMLSSLFNPSPQFKGRRVATFHNQRDFIFFRHHRYIFSSANQARLQELGPRFTLKLISLQEGTFNQQQGEYEYIHKTQIDDHRRKFIL